MKAHVTNSTQPPVARDLDLRHFPDMPLSVSRLRDSESAAIMSDKAFRAAVLLWCAAWHQIPASSLPADDMLLAHYAGFGRDIKNWLKVKKEAMRNFVLCTDGRFYHPVIAEKAIESDNRRRAFKERTAKATEARRQRYDQRYGDRSDHQHSQRNEYEEKGREENKKEPIQEEESREVVHRPAPVRFVGGRG